MKLLSNLKSLLIDKTFLFQSPAAAGNYSLYLEFDGSLSIGITGFYKSVYKNSAGEDVPIATSKFQPTDARKAFPCFDEPSFKSTFSVTLVRPTDGYIALSNMPVQDEQENSPSSGKMTLPATCPTLSNTNAFSARTCQIAQRNRERCKTPIFLIFTK